MKSSPLVFVFAAALAACTPTAVPPPAPTPADPFGQAADRFFERYFAFNPATAAAAGLHEYDGRLGPRDSASIAAYAADLHALETEFAAMDSAMMSADQRLDRDLILREIRGALFWLEDVGTPWRNPMFYSGEMDMTLLLLLDYAPLEQRMEAVVSRLEHFPGLVAAARANVTDPPRPFVETALIIYGGWPGFLEEDLTQAMAPVQNPALQARFVAARDSAARALRGYAEHLSEVLPTADGDFALGPERYHRMNSLLAGVDLPTAELKRVGQAERARLTALTDSLARVIAPGKRVAAAFDSLGNSAPAPDAIVSTAADVIGELKEFVRDDDIGTVLQGDVEVEEIPPFARTNFAYIFIPGPFETSVNTGFYFIHPVEREWSAATTRDFLRKNNRWTILNTSVHEAYPGHYQHFTHVNRAPTRAQQLLTAYVTTEGWAHYGEEMSWRQGLEESNPRLGLAVAQDALLRVVRFLASIGLHTEGMTVGQAERMFSTVAYQDSVNAHQQALRGTYDPEYLNYTLGKLMIRRLRGDAEVAARARGEEFDLRAFHDDFMSHGAPPVTWIGRRMMRDEGWHPFGDGGQ